MYTATKASVVVKFGIPFTYSIEYFPKGGYNSYGYSTIKIECNWQVCEAGNFLLTEMKVGGY